MSTSPDDDLADYLLDTYGECELGSGRCYHGPGPRCLRTGWRGRECPHWKTLDARTLDELRTKYREQSVTKN